MHPEINAQYHCNTHVGKMAIEGTQMLSTAWRLKGYKMGMEITHVNHPMSIWVRESWENYYHAYSMTLALFKEFEYRYNKIHVAYYKLMELPHPIDSKHIFDKEKFTLPPLCVDEDCKCDNLVEAYRQYYRKKQHVWTTRTDKRRIIMKWTNRQKPDFLF
jgi:hypothetical protein